MARGVLFLVDGINLVRRNIDDLIRQVAGLLAITAESTPQQAKTRRIGDSNNVDSLLYVALESTAPVPTVTQCLAFLERFYTSCYKICQIIDVQLFLDSLILEHHSSQSLSTIKPFLLTTDNIFLGHHESIPSSHIADLRSRILELVSSTTPRVLSCDGGSSSSEEGDAKVPSSRYFVESPGCCSSVDKFKKYPGVVLGGTFDRLHCGHKILLSTAALLAQKKLTVGVTDGAMLKSKILYELIEPVTTRMTAVTQFLNNVAPSLELKVVPITDPFGPSTVDSDLQCIVASKETERGAKKVCEIRKDKDLSDLDIYLIDLADEEDPSSAEAFDESKISSSKLRAQQLGTLLRPPKATTEVSEASGIEKCPYVIGLTGGIASGKSTLAAHLETLGATVIDCDGLGHEAYSPGTACHSELIKVFGTGIVSNQANHINRKALGAIVFSDQTEMNKLNGIVWPEIKRLIVNNIKEYSSNNQQKTSVIVLDAAILLEAGWDVLCNEVWTCTIPEREAIRRLQERNQLSIEQATERLARQMSPVERLSKSNVILCSYWSYPVTHKQVQKTWERVKLLTTAAY